MITPVVETADIERLAAFYRDALGAVEEQRVPEDGPLFFVNLRVGTGLLGLVRAADSEGGYAEAPDPGRLAPVGRILLDVAVPDPDAALRAVAAAGGEAAEEANDMPWGQRVGHAADIDGNPINLSAPVSAEAASAPT